MTMDSETKAIYRNEFYKDQRRFLVISHNRYRDGISDIEFAELAQEAMDDFKNDLAEGFFDPTP